jgi:large subunit ribosomal protein L35
MGKQKTKKAIAKRFRKSARGKLLYTRPGKSHLNTSKSSKRKRSMRRTATVSPAFVKRFSVLIPG